MVAGSNEAPKRVSTHSKSTVEMHGIVGKALLGGSKQNLPGNDEFKI